MPQGIISSLLVGIGLSILGCFALRQRTRPGQDYLGKIAPCSPEWIASTKYNSGKMGHSLNKPEGATE